MSEKPEFRPTDVEQKRCHRTHEPRARWPHAGYNREETGAGLGWCCGSPLRRPFAGSMAPAEWPPSGLTRQGYRPSGNVWHSPQRWC